MFIIDDILLFPAKSMLWIFREVHNAVQQEKESESSSITTQLSELYMMLETGIVSEEDFLAQEKELLDRLEVIEDAKYSGENDDNKDEEEDEEEDEEVEYLHNAR
ncbi:MAG: hypothetical protein FD167_5517 [bacterium]|nr:MAG: hypothetical protein FD167_5517 [bacterium]